MLSQDEKIAVLKTAQKVAVGAGPADHQRAGINTRGRRGRQACGHERRERDDDRASPIYSHQRPGDRRIAEGDGCGRRPAVVTIYSNRVVLPGRRHRRGDGGTGRRPAVRGDWSSDDIRRLTEIINRFGDRF